MIHREHEEEEFCEGNIRFFAFGDLHYDEMDDGDRRIDELLSHIKRYKPDFCISLGDFCNPIEKNKGILKKFESIGIPIYYTIGNHETDYCHLKEILNFYSLDSPYYSFEYKKCKFIVLDSCYWSKNGQEYSYYHRNYKNEEAIFPVIPVAEMRWLKRELEDGKHHIIFSHHSLVNDFKNRGIYNRTDVRNLFSRNKVVLCMNGHDHGDDLSIVDNVPFYTVNSASYMWAGQQIVNSETLTQQYAYLKGILPYKQALCVLVEIDGAEIKLKGMDSEYLSITPEDIGLCDYFWNGVSIKPQTSSYNIKY